MPLNHKQGFYTLVNYCHLQEYINYSFDLVVDVSQL